jgi:O-antigen/teichoic acid export membrane protein
MSEAQDARDNPRLEAHIARVVRWVLVMGSLYMGAIALFPGPILSLFGSEFTAGAGALVLLGVAQLANSSTGLLDTAMLSSGRPRINLQNMVLLLVVQTGLNLWLIPRWGILGAASASLSAYGAVSALRVAQTYGLLGLRPLGRTHLKPLAAAAAAAGVVALVRGLAPSGALPLEWVAYLAAYAALYALLLKTLGFEPEDAELLRAALGRGKERPSSV